MIFSQCGVCVCVCVCACVRACVRACVGACVRAGFMHCAHSVVLKSYSQRKQVLIISPFPLLRQVDFSKMAVQKSEPSSLRKRAGFLSLSCLNNITWT